MPQKEVLRSNPFLLSFHAIECINQRVVAVDSSLPALQTATENLKTNGVEHLVELVKADAVEYMRTMSETNAEFDVVICDPPKLAPTRKDLARAVSKYTTHYVQ